MKELFTALAKAQAELKNPTFDAANPHFKNKFASLAQVRNTVTPVLAKHGISVIQNLTSTDWGVACETILAHESGEHMRLGPLVIPATKTDAQGFGSAATYARRYSLMAVAGVVGDADDDANAAVDTHKKIDTKLVNQYAERINEAVRGDIEGRLAEVWGECTEAGTEFATAVWATLTMPVKNKIRDLKTKEAA